MKILAIETSCDETAAAVAEDFEVGVKILSNVVSSQIDIHKKYGGVVPEVAAREHVLDILPVIDEALEVAGIRRDDLINKKSDLDAIAVTVGPGLMSSLQSGVETAKNLAYVWDLPIVGVNHVEGHIYANFINLEKNIDFPALILTVSGGHTMLVLMKGHGDFEVVGDTRDDAAGESFDKAAKLMGLAYPGGPVISARAEKLKIKNPARRVADGEELRIKLPRPMIQSDDFDFSFSGLKTAIRYKIEKDDDWRNKVDEYCYEFQEAVVDVLVFKTIKAVKKFEVKTVMLAGGVAANKRLREVLQKNVEEKLNNVRYTMPELKYTTDNAAMIASAGIFRAKKNDFIGWKDLRADCNFGFVK